jgi:peptide deformylase
LTVREIVTIGKPDLSLEQGILFEACQSTEAANDAVDVVIQDLIDTMHAHETCVGLAAPQIGVRSRIAVVKARVTPDLTDLILVDPILLSASGKKDGKNEACMSLPGWYGLVKRKPHIELSFTDASRSQRIIGAEDYFARVIQHELDHLDGILYPCRMRPEDELVARDDAERPS